MKYRRFGRTNWSVSEIGYGMWGLSSWKETDAIEVRAALRRAVELGCNFFDTAWAYGNGLSEQILGGLVKDFPGHKLYVASKIPPKNRRWPSTSAYSIDEVFPADYIAKYVDKSLKNLGVEQIDLLQFHVWQDEWAQLDDWKTVVEQLTSEGKVSQWGISLNRWEPENSLNTLRTGFISTVQVIYNIFDQAPEEALFPLCRQLDIGVIARVPFDEGTLTGQLTADTIFPDGDWRATYFVEENLKSSVKRAEALRSVLPDGVSMPEMALRFILSNDDVHTTIPGMRKLQHVQANIAASDKGVLPAALRSELRKHRWDRQPTKWSQ